MSKSSWMMDPTLSRYMPSCSAIDLAEIRRSSKISSWIWSIISGVSLFWVVQDEACDRWKNHHVQTVPPSSCLWHTLVHVPLMFLSEWREFPSTPCLAEKKNLMTARVSMLLKPRASPDLLPFNLCNKSRLAIRYMNRQLFPTTLSIPSYDIRK